jgi:hypothetical protein
MKKEIFDQKTVTKNIFGACFNGLKTISSQTEFYKPVIRSKQSKETKHYVQQQNI